MKITELAVDRSTTVIVLLALIVGMGIVSFSQLPRETMPEVSIPFVSVSVVYPGVAPADMESLVTIPIERQLAGLSGIENLTSNSAEGFTSIVVEFDPDEPMDEATQKVRDRVELARADLPPDAEDAIVQESNFDDMPVVLVSLTGPIGLTALSDLAEDLEDELEALPGVLDVEIIGAVEREIQIIADPVRVAEYGVPMTDLLQIAQQENINTPAGAMRVGDARYSMRVPGEIRGAAEIRDLVVKRGPKGVVYVRDLAVVQNGIKEIQSYARLNGSPSITLTVTKRSGENVIEMVEAVKALLDQAEQRLPAGVTLTVTMDQSKEIASSVEGLVNSILSGLVLVLAVLFLFLGFANAFFVALAIPVSLLLTFIVMNWTGISLNNVSLFSLMVALGMLVDNGIVVVENIFRHGQMGKPRVQAAKDGTAEVAWPIFASTVTTLAAFFPMIFWPGMMGKFMSLLPKTVSIALIASLFVGLIVNPALASVFARPRRKRRSTMAEEPIGRHPVLDAYGFVLKQALAWRAVTVALVIVLMAVIVRVYLVDFRYEFLPGVEPEQASVDIRGPEGASLNATDLVAREIEGKVSPYHDTLEYVIANVGSRSVGAMRDPSEAGGGQTTHLGGVTLDFPEAATMESPPSAVIHELRDALTGIAGAEVFIEATDNMGPPTADPVNIELTGDDFEVLASLTEEIRRYIQDIPGLVDLQDDLKRGKPEVRVVVDRQQAKMAALNTQYIGTVVQAAVNGTKAGEYRDGDEEYDVTIRFPEHYREDLSNIESMPIVNLNGEPVPFSSVARLEQAAGLGSITRVDRKRMVTISAGAEGRLGPEVLADVQAALEELPLPPGYQIAFTGENEDVAETTVFLGRAFVIAMFLISLVLITQFNSIIQPLVIMSSVILSFGGVFVGLLLFDMPFSVMMNGIGCVSLAGIVVNNAIVLVDFINQLRREGRALDEAIILAGKIRFRPVLLTAVTTILGLIPLAFGFSFNVMELKWEFGGSSTQYWGPMAVAIIFGLAFATVLTLVIVPVLYSLGESFAGLFRRGDSAERVRFTTPSEPVTK